MLKPTWNICSVQDLQDVELVDDVEDNVPPLEVVDERLLLLEEKA